MSHNGKYVKPSLYHRRHGWRILLPSIDNERVIGKSLYDKRIARKMAAYDEKMEEARQRELAKADNAVIKSEKSKSQ